MTEKIKETIIGFNHKKLFDKDGNLIDPRKTEGEEQWKYSDMKLI